MIDHDKFKRLVNQYSKDLIARMEQPYCLHFYETKFDGRLRIFDLFKDQETGCITCGESLISGMKPIATLFTPPIDAIAYVHVNYGGLESQDPDAFIRDFAKQHNLTDVRKMGETKIFSEVPPFMKIVLAKLEKEYAN